MIVGSVLPVTLRRQAEVKGAHRTAGPDHESGSSGPMYPKPLDARFRITSPVKGEVYPPPFPHRIAWMINHLGFDLKGDRISSKPEHARRALTRTK